MEFSFDFQAPKYFDFSKKYPEKSLLTLIDPLNENDAFFLVFKESLQKQPPLNVPPKNGPSDQLATEINKAPQNDAVSKKETIKEIDVNTKKTLNQDPIQQEKKESIQRHPLQIPKDVPAEIQLILTQKKEVISKVQEEKKPSSGNIIIEAIKRQSTNIFAPGYISPKPNNIFATGNLPANTTNVFAPKVQEKPAVIPRPSLYPFGLKGNQSESREPIAAVNRQPLNNYFGGYGTSNAFGPLNLINGPVFFGGNFPQQNHARSNQSLNAQIKNPLSSSDQSKNVFTSNNQQKNPFASNNQQGQANRSFSAASMPYNQPPPQKRPRPCLFPIRIQREWEEAHGKKWYQLQSHEISAAQESMRKRQNRQNGTNLGSNPNIFGNNTNQNQANQKRNTFHNPHQNNNGKGKPFKF